MHHELSRPVITVMLEQNIAYLLIEVNLNLYGMFAFICVRSIQQANYLLNFFYKTGYIVVGKL